MKILAFVYEGKIEMILDETVGTDVIQEYVNKFKDGIAVHLEVENNMSIEEYILSACELYDKGLVQADNLYFNNVLVTAIRWG
jgi:hypothetical protein